MKKGCYLLISIMFPIFFTMFVGCTTDKKNQNQTASTPVADTTGAPKGPAQLTLSGTLGPLEATVAQFQKLTLNAAVFAFRVNEDHSVGLGGWKIASCNSATLESPEVSFQSTAASDDDTLAFNKIIYLGNNVLQKVNNLQRDISSSGATHVMLVPSLYGSSVRFKVYIRSDNSAKPFTPRILEYETNPSPPKKWNDAAVD